MVDRHISVLKPFASGDATEWFQANNWNGATIALNLPTLLEEEALAIWFEFDERDRSNYTRAQSQFLEAITT